MSFDGIQPVSQKCPENTTHVFQVLCNNNCEQLNRSKVLFRRTIRRWKGQRFDKFMGQLVYAREHPDMSDVHRSELYT